jgi:hypothetical protein
VRSILIGIVLAGLTIALVAPFKTSQGFAFLSLLLAFIAAIYLGFAFADGSYKAIILESFVAVVFLLVAAFASFTSPLVLAGGYVVHGFWDLLHHPKAIETKVARWYPPFCAVYDWAIAVYILVAWWR